LKGNVHTVKTAPKDWGPGQAQKTSWGERSFPAKREKIVKKPEKGSSNCSKILEKNKFRGKGEIQNQPSPSNLWQWDEIAWTKVKKA